jgi:hypothetical protein
MQHYNKGNFFKPETLVKYFLFLLENILQDAEIKINAFSSFNQDLFWTSGVNFQKFLFVTFGRNK